MKNILKRTAAILLFCVLTVGLSCSCCIVRRSIIAGDWSDPNIRLIQPSVKYNADGSVVLVVYGYHITQTVPLKYPYYVWKHTAWEGKVSTRSNLIAGGSALATIDIKTGDISFPPVINTPTHIFRSGSGWVVFTSTHAFHVTRADAKAIFTTGQGESIKFVTLDDEQILFCVHKEWKAKCLSLNLNSEAVTDLYTFATSDMQPRRQIVHLNEDRTRTVFVSRSDSRKLAIGIKESDSTPLRMLEPHSMVPGATSYFWALSGNKRQIVLSFYTPERATWVLDLDTLTISPSDPPSGLPVAQTNALPHYLRQPLIRHLETTFLGKPGKRNFYNPIKKKE